MSLVKALHQNKNIPTIIRTDTTVIRLLVYFAAIQSIEYYFLVA